MIVDDRIMMLEGLKSLMGQEHDIKIVAEARDFAQCINKLSEQKVDAVILNLCMKRSFDLLEKLNYGLDKRIKTLVLVNECETLDVVKMVDIGADGYLSMRTCYEELLMAVRAIMNGEVYLQSNLLTLFYQYHEIVESDMKKEKSLTKRELEILQNMALGMYNKEIAIRLGISERTVKNHIFNIFKKIGCTDRTQAAVFAIRNKMVELYG